MTVLLVDDDALLRRVLRRSLVSLGLCVDDAGDADVALRLVKTRCYEVALLDVEMPVVDGVALGARLRATVPSLPLVYMTAGPLETAKARTAVLRPMGVFSKVHELRSLLRVTTALSGCMRPRLADDHA